MADGFNREGTGAALIYRHTDGHTFTAVAMKPVGDDPTRSRIENRVEQAVLRAHLLEALRLLDPTEFFPEEDV